MFMIIVGIIAIMCFIMIVITTIVSIMIAINILYITIPDYSYEYIIAMNTGVCKINTRSENTRYDSQPPAPQRSMLTK